MRKAQAIAVWSIVSALYIVGCFWLYFGTLNFDGLDFMSPEDVDYMVHAHITALLGVLTTAPPSFVYGWSSKLPGVLDA